ncbi:MAG: C45 family peptidase [Anaerolineae bacterium]|nr:C45 family peptidase [Anaerolineae bacterium]
MEGDHVGMGFQHGRQAADLRGAIIKRIAAVESKLADDRADAAFSDLIAETAAVLARHSPQTIAVMRGLSAGLDLPYEALLRYNLAPFLRDVLTTRQRLAEEGRTTEGCTTWAATGTATADGGPILAKNRDYAHKHLALQTIIRATPEGGYRYTYVTSAGSPGVFVAGFNEAGLAVVDTHVSTTDTGAGLPMYALAMHVLEEHSRVRSALDYLCAAPRLGRNNLILADASGDIACFEAGHAHYSVREAAGNILVNTNHFNDAEMPATFVDTEPEELRGNSFQRYQQATQALAGRAGQIDLAWAEALMRSHDAPPASICRHPHGADESATIASIFLLPAQRTMVFHQGQPCAPAAPRAVFHY